MSGAAPVALVAAFLLGAVPFGLLLGRLTGVDVRRRGSGNIGATNVLRAAGPGAGMATLLLDAAKGAAGPGLAGALDLPAEWRAAMGLAAVAGHCFSPFLRGRGGKGVATLVGAFAVLDPLSTAIGGAVFALSVLTLRYVALSSLLLALALTVSLALRLGLTEPRVVTAALATLLIMWRHRANWERIRSGTEPRAFAREKS